MPDSENPPSPQLEVALGATVDPLVGREVGGYVIEAALGEGGMGLVYQARHPFLGRRFAIKVLRPELAADKQLSSNFVREAQTLSGLKHPHIIDIVGFGPLDDQRQYMVMEFLEGRTLEAELEEHGALPVYRALALSEEILDALEAAHSIDVIHRDLKPSNVFLAKVSGGTYVSKLLDFGLAKLQPSSLASDPNASAARSAVAGTPDYIAPEQALGAGVSKLSDLYSFGVMLYEVLKGEKLFAAKYMSLDPIHDLLQQHLHKRAPSLGDGFPPELEQLVAELLEKDPTKRPQGVQLVRQRLRRMARDLQREQTRAGPNPFGAAAAGAITQPIGPASVPDLDPRALIPSRLVPLSILAGVGLVALLGPGLWWLTHGTTQPQLPPVIVAAPVAPVVAAPPAAPVIEVEDDLSPLSEIARKKQQLAAKKAVPPAPLVVAPSPAPAATGCEPNDKWRTASRAHLQELQQLAASKGNAAVWDRFEDAEAQLTGAIGSASTGAQCDTVERKIQQLAKELSR